MLNTFVEERLSEIGRKGLNRSLKLMSGAQGPKINIEGKDVLNFCSNNYLGLANDPRLKTAAMNCIEREGFGSGASRLVCGNMNAHEQLEEEIAAFKGTESCLVFSTGYMANVGMISSLFGRDDIIFCDRLNHASILDGVTLSQAKLRRYPHCDMESLEEMLASSSSFKKRAIITDSVFSMDGDIAPLDKIVELAKKYNCLVMIDEAHALGVMGRNGRGLAEHFDVEDKIDVQMGTLSKAAGSFGAYFCGSKELRSFFINKARSFIYTTGMPPSVAAASRKAIEIISQDHPLRAQLWSNTHHMRESLQKMGFDTLNSQTPIIPILVKDSNVALEFSKRLFAAGVFISAIRPPTVPVNTARLRLTVVATHLREQIDFTLAQIKEVGEELCLL